MVGLHGTVGSVRPQSDNKAVQYSLSYIGYVSGNVFRVIMHLLELGLVRGYVVHNNQELVARDCICIVMSVLGSN
jgi:hypothetical protein